MLFIASERMSAHPHWIRATDTLVNAVGALACASSPRWLWSRSRAAAGD
jgi:hypothetical protein